jgi:hypothetical protein
MNFCIANLIINFQPCKLHLKKKLKYFFKIIDIFSNYLIFIYKEKNMNLIILFTILIVLLFYSDIRDNVINIVKDLLIAIVSLIAFLIKGIKKLKR